VHLATPALGLVLRMEGQRRSEALGCHVHILRAGRGLRKT
jgi:hypothetical protein